MKNNERITELERITALAIKSVKQYRHADSENDKWRERHAHWPELEKIITDKEHLEVEALYNKAGDTMDETIRAFKNHKKGIVTAAIPPRTKETMNGKPYVGGFPRFRPKTAYYAV